MRKINISLILMCLFVFSLFYSCGKKEEEKNNGKVTIKLTSWFAEDKPLWLAMIAEFEKTHPDIHVELEQVVYSMHVQKLLTSSAAKVPVADLIIIEDWFAQELLERDYFVDLSTYIKSEVDTSVIFMKSLEDYTNSKGELVAFPNFLISTVLFYNKDLFDEAGMSYPDSTWTYDDLLTAAKKLTKDIDNDGIIDRWGLQLSYSPFLDVLLYSFGGGVLDPSKSHSFLDKPESIRAIQYFIDLYRVHKVGPSPDPAAMSNAGSFQSGRYAMAILSDFKDKFRGLKFKWDLTYPPKGIAGRKSIRNSIGFGIPKSCKHFKESWIFLKWLITSLPPKYSDLAKGLMPNNKRIVLSKEYLDAEPKCSRSILIDIQNNYSFNFLRPAFSELKDYGFQSAIEKAIGGGCSVEDAARDGSRKIEEVIKRSSE